MLRDHFYKVVSFESQGLNSCRSTVHLLRESPVFEGHFPSAPVVPGVCMLQMIKEQLEEQTEKSLRLVRAANIKFLSIINPIENPDLVLDILYDFAEDGTITAEGSISFQDKVFFKIARAVYK